MELEQAIAARIRQLCVQQHVTLYRLAKQTGLPRSTLYALASGKRKDPLIVTVVKVSIAFGLTPAEFFSSDLFRE